MPNLDAIEQNRGDLKEALRRALNGESATFRNINRKHRSVTPERGVFFVWGIGGGTKGIGGP